MRLRNRGAWRGNGSGVVAVGSLATERMNDIIPAVVPGAFEALQLTSHSFAVRSYR